MHINSSIPNLIGGVSQQPELLRLPSHLRVQENGYSTASKGLSKRPSSTHSGTCPSFSGEGYHKTLDFGSRGVFHMEVDNGTGTLRMVKEDGTAVPMYDSEGFLLGSLSYLTTATPETSLKVVQEADTAFIINTDIVVQQKVNPPAASVWMALVWVKAGNYGRDYSVTVPGFGTATYTTPDGSSASHSVNTKTNVIASSLAAQLSNLGIPGVTVSGSVITFIYGGYNGMTVDDGSGGNAMGLAYKSVRSIADLPSSNAANNFTVKIEGGDATGAGDHYLLYDAINRVYKETSNPLEGWPEPFAPTMPVMLQPYQDGFKVSPIQWGGRKVGDADTNPSPTFIGNRITDICFYQDRMVMLAGEDFNISEVGEYFNFYRTTVVDLLDSDPIIGTVSHPKVSTLRHALPFNKRLLFFSDKAQFELASGDFITPKSVATVQLTQFECSSFVRPVGLGNSLYFPVDKGDFSAFYNFFVNGVESLEDAADISGHVAEYIPKNVTQMVASPVNNLVMALSKEDASAIYVYQFYQDGQQRLQSAWHRWPYVASGDILCMDVVGTRLILLVRRSTGSGTVVCSESIPLSADLKGYRLDRKVTLYPQHLSVVGTGLSQATGFMLPYAAGTGTYYAVVVQGSATVKPGTLLKVSTDPGSAACSVRGNLTGCTIQVGLNYTFRATLGRFLLREQAGAGSAGVSRGRTQVARLWVNYADSATFTVEVASEGRGVKSYKATGRVLGTPSATIGEPVLEDGRFGCPVLAENTKVEITLVNDTPLPSSFLSVDWEGYHVSRGQHV